MPSSDDRTDLPEPDDTLSSTGAATPDHEPSDGDDREVLLDEPEQPDPPVDDADRDPAAAADPLRPPGR